MILCAGVSYHNIFKDTMDLGIYREMMNINFFGYMYPTYYILPHMIKQHQDNPKDEKPQIAVISSVSGELGLPLRAGYCASKFAVNGFFNALRLEIQDHIDLTMLMPTTVNTPMRNNSLGQNEKKSIEFHEDDNKKMTIDQCCQIIIQAIDQRKRKVIFPFSNYLATLVQPFFPKLIDNIVKKKAGGQVKLQSKL
ncbi:short-chain dehydrogenase/reductase (SDR) family protein [Tieghemostelium lacteum]|uniref:Short-chain dehydrogenase/reductase (SDR) family protein n=1 Tax=Tieghemostelium lacteum TaxID=361077 RepID=A0A151Z2X8_TIELA|nr:short-chain dehydrogenase/reductase (SDR) family protein [Tieghemostelium lacteum]|eukprot:KYQ88164.1 short-chain dehydrogenase/reductase (SDR) family protein [Tieghemostelium lacteum]